MAPPDGPVYSTGPSIRIKPADHNAPEPEPENEPEDDREGRADDEWEDDGEGVF